MLVHFPVVCNLPHYADLFLNDYWLYLVMANVIKQVSLGEKEEWDRQHSCLCLYHFTKDSEAVISVT